MTRIKGRSTLFLALIAGAAVVGIITTPLIAGATVSTDLFGFMPVRSGIPVATPRFDLTSPELENNQPFMNDQVANIFGCNGGNKAPTLHWSGAPASTQSYVVTMFDPDAPTGSGFWHWLTWDIPANVHSLGSTPPAGAVSGTNDAGFAGYLGPCPPAGDRTHRYQLTVYALDVQKLNLPSSTRAAVVGFSMRLHILAFGRLIATFQRPLS